MTIPTYQDAIDHYLAGIAVSFGDRLFSNNAKRHTQARMKKKLQRIEALRHLSKDESKPDAEKFHDPQYRQALREARDYFLDRGTRIKKVSSSRVGTVMNELSAFVGDYKDHERLNNLGIKNKFGAAFGIEFLADTCVGVYQLLGGSVNTLTAAGDSLYQGPALFLGLLTGRGFLYLKDFFRSKEEKKLDVMGKDLTEDGKLLQIVKTFYAQPPTVFEEPVSESSETKGNIAEKAKEKLVTFGSGLVQKMKDVREGLKQRKKVKEEAEEKHREELRRKYDNY